MQENNNYILSIVIVNWNSKQFTLECLESIYVNKFFIERPERIEIILIDNNSSDDSVPELSNRFPKISIISNNENYGYAIACNQGMKIARGKYVLLLGNDTALKENALSECINFLGSNENCGAVGCRLIYPDGTLQGNCKKFPKFKNALYTYLSLDKLNFDYDMLWFDYASTIEVDQISTTFLMVRNDILKKIGYFDEQYKILYNDVDLCKKIWNCGYSIYFLHTAETIHFGSHSTQKAGYKVRKIMYFDILRYYRNKFGYRAYLLYPILVFRLFFVSFLKFNFLF
jgi:GT2 family glycosyltransferase